MAPKVNRSVEIMKPQLWYEMDAKLVDALGGENDLLYNRVEAVIDTQLWDRPYIPLSDNPWWDMVKEFGYELIHKAMEAAK